MASAAEQLVANLNFGAFGKAKELKQRLLFTLGALIVYRIGIHIPLPGIDAVAYAKFFQSHSNTVLGMFNLFAGGALQRMAIFALNIMPYISSSIIMQLMTTVSPTLEALKKEGEAGRKKINQYTRYGTVILAALQSYGIAMGLLAQGVVTHIAPFDSSFFFILTTVITLTGGTVFLMWLGEQITARGVGNGISLLIFSGIVAGLPGAVSTLFVRGASNDVASFVVPVLLVVIPAVTFFIVFMERAQRRLLVQYPKRQVGNKMYGGESSHLPLKLNISGVIPPIFASSLLLLPLTATSFAPDSGPSWLRDAVAMLGHGTPLYMALYAAGIIFFAFFYTAIVMNPVDTADNLKKYGGFIPGFRPGKRTADYIDYVMTRLTVVGALYITAVCLLPEFLIAQWNMPFYFGGTSLLIVISVTMDTVAQIQSHLLAHQYEGLIKKAKLRGSRR